MDHFEGQQFILFTIDSCDKKETGVALIDNLNVYYKKGADCDPFLCTFVFDKVAVLWFTSQYHWHHVLDDLLSFSQQVGLVPFCQPYLTLSADQQ